MEDLNLTTPITKPSVTTYRVVILNLDWEGARIFITLKGSDGLYRSFDYNDATALSLMNALNKANLTIKSLHRRVIERLQLDFPGLSGAINGVPD